MPGRSKFPHIGLRPDSGSIASTNDSEKLFADATLGYEGTVFKIAPTAVRFEYNTDIVDITGEFSGNLTGDLITETQVKQMSYVKGRMTMIGDVPSASAIGLANLETTESIDVSFMLGVGAHDHDAATVVTKVNRIQMKIVPESVVIDWNMERPSVQVTIVGRMTTKYTDNSHPIQEAQNTAGS